VAPSLNSGTNNELYCDILSLRAPVDGPCERELNSAMVDSSVFLMDEDGAGRHMRMLKDANEITDVERW